MTSSFRNLVLALGLAFLCVAAPSVRASDIEPPTGSNPAPEAAFSTYNHFEVKPIAMEAPYAGQEANEKAKIKIQQNLDLRLNPLIAEWNKKAPAGAATKTLVIEPVIQQIKFINATARVWGGGFAGASGVLLQIRFVDSATGKAIASPVFYQRANKMGGAWSFGATDNNMLVRITEVATKYIEANYASAVGGPTGAEAKK